MNNFFTGNKTSSNYSRTYSKGKSFKFSVWNSKDTYNNDEFIQDFVQWNKTLWAAKKTSTNIPPKEGEYWELIVKGVSDIEFRQVDNRIEYRYIDPTSEWKDLVELASVSKEQIKNMLEDLDIKYGNTYDVKLSETSTNAVQNQAVTKKFKKLDEKNTETDNELTNIKSSVTTTLRNAKSYTDLKISETKRDIDAELEKKANQTEVDESVEELDKKISKKVDKISGKGLSTNDFNNEYKVKLDNLNSSLNNTLSSAKSYTNSEIAEVDNKINSEINRAKTSETNLSDRIDDLEEGLTNALNEAKEYTDSEVKNNTNKINILNGTGEGSVKKTVKDEIAKVVDAAPEELDTLREIAAKLADSEDIAAGLVETLTELENKKADKTELNNLKTETDSELQSLDQSKANTTGRYPEMSVGFADDLVGRGESVPAEFGFRASGGKSIKDGRAYIKRIKGNSVVWNQLFEPRTDDRSYNEYGAYITDNKDGSYTISTIEGGVTQRVNRTLAITHDFSYAGHKLLITGCDGAVDGFGFWDSFSNSIGTNFKNNVIVSATTNGSVAFSVIIVAGKAVPQTTWKPRVYDLTKMFGAGNEPTTFEEYEARKPIVEDEYAYNEGEVIHMTAGGIKSVGDNAWDGVLATSLETSKIRCLSNEQYCLCGPYYNGGYHSAIFYDSEDNEISRLGYSVTFFLFNKKGSIFTTPANCAYFVIKFNPNYPVSDHKDQIVISLYHSGWKQDTDAGYQPYWEDRLIFDQRIKDEFPNGMKKWDMVYNKNGKGYIVKGTRVVKMKDLNWIYYSESGLGNTMVRATLEGIKIPTTSEERVQGVIVSRYYPTQDNPNVDRLQNKCWLHMNGEIFLKDDSFADAESFVASLTDNDVIIYELAEPTIIEYDEPFNLDYRVADFGTEQAIAETNSAPISADIIYQFNAVDMIRENYNEIQKLKTNGGNSYDDTEIKDNLAELSEEVGKKVDANKVATINGQSLINGGNIEIKGGGESYDDTEIREDIANLSEIKADKSLVETIYNNFSAEVNNKVDADFVNNAIAAAITTTLNEEV